MADVKLGKNIFKGVNTVKMHTTDGGKVQFTAGISIPQIMPVSKFSIEYKNVVTIDGDVKIIPVTSYEIIEEE